MTSQPPVDPYGPDDPYRTGHDSTHGASDPYQPAGSYPASAYPEASYPDASYPAPSANTYDPNTYAPDPYAPDAYGAEPQAGASYPVPYPYPGSVGPPQSGLALAGMILGIIGLVTCSGIPSIVGLVLSLVARKETRDGSRSGDGLAVAGLITSIAGLVILALGIIVYVAFVVIMIGASSSS